MKKGNISLEINAEVVEGPRGLSIQSLRYKETLSNGDNVYEIIREDNNVIGEITVKKGDKGNTGEKGDTGRGIIEVKKVEKIGKANNWEIKYTDGISDFISVLDGDTAFEVAVDNGFTWEWTGEGEEPEDYGEKEWLKSLIGKGLEFNWAGTQLGVRVEGETEYQYSDDLKGEKGDKGDTGKAFYIAKTYSSVGEMQADFNNNTVKTGEYVIISSTDGDNGKIFEKKESSFEFIVQMGSSGGESKYLFVDEGKGKLVISNMDKTKFEALGEEECIIGINSGGKGKRNTVIGNNAFQKNINGACNVVIGRSGMPNNTDGSYNVAIGDGALRGNTTGSFNVALGQNSLRANVVGAQNIALGQNSLTSNIVGIQNIALGQNSLASNIGGEQNIAIGHQALMNNIYGSRNVALGGGTTLFNNKNGNDNVAIGFSALTYTDFTNTIGIGRDTQVTADNQAQIGNSNVTVYCYGAVQNRSDKRDKTDIQDTNLGLNFLMKLRPREYRWDYREDYINREEMEKELKILEETKIEEEEKTKKREEILKKYSLENVIKDGKQKGWRLHQGFIAQEVFETMRELGVDFGGYQDHSINGGKDVLSLGYEEFIPILVKGLQEQQKEIEELKNKIEKLEGKK